MATSSGTEVEVEVEEEVEYVEEVVEYEEIEVEEEEDDKEEQASEPKPVHAAVQPETEEPTAEKLSAKVSDAEGQGEEEEEEEEEEEDEEEEDDDNDDAAAALIPPSTSAQEVPVRSKDSAPSQATPAKPDAVVDAELAPRSSAGGAPGNAGGSVDFKQLEVQAAKLTAGLRSAFGGAEQSAGGAGASLTKLAGGLSSWWGSLDPAPQPVRDETAEIVASSNKASGELQELFGLSAEENLVEHFKCKLLQTYACSHNPHTPAIQMAFQGTLYVTDRHTCFSVEERGRKVPFKVTHNQVVKATRQRPARKGDLSDVLKMELSNGQYLAFKDFESGSALDSALALVEHLMDGS